MEVGSSELSDWSCGRGHLGWAARECRCLWLHPAPCCLTLCRLPHLGLPLAVALLPHQRLHCGLFPDIRRTLLLLKAADHGDGEYDSVLRLHDDNGFDLLSFYR